jgi:predicted DNA-binding ribbon-helix-helix protein
MQVVRLGKRTMRLEPELWDGVREICKREQISQVELVRRVAETHTAGTFAGAMRVFLFGYFREAERGSHP